MQDVLLLNKQVGETPLACIERFKKDHTEYQGVKMTYAGRLDPIASGLLVVLAGDKVHEKESYLHLPKTYQCTALIGVATDTYDLLGIPLSRSHHVGDCDNQSLAPAPLSKGSQGFDSVQLAVQSFVGTFQQAYPPYSSKTVDGKQLHQIAREGKISEVKIPEQTVTVEKIWDVEMREISRSEISRQITDTIGLVTGDFRQAEILDAWQKVFDTSDTPSFQVLSFTIAVSGGTYIRGIVNNLGGKLGIGACILSLHRTKVGDFTL